MPARRALLVAAIGMALKRFVADDLDVSDGCFACVCEHFSEADALELAFIIGHQLFASKFAKACRLAPQGCVARA